MKALLLCLTLMSTSLLAQEISTFDNREGGGRVAASAVYVEFNSPGDGIDYEAYELYVDLVKSADEAGVLQEQTMRTWGREGERTGCVNFTDVGLSRKFISKLAPLIVVNGPNQIQKTQVYVGVDCSDISKATLQDIKAYLK